MGLAGMIKLMLAGAINDPEFYPLTSLVCVENTTNKGGGACYELGRFAIKRFVL
jgi:threonine aldolase